MTARDVEQALREGRQTTDGGVAGRNARDLIIRFSAMKPKDIDAMAFAIVEQFKKAVAEAHTEARQRAILDCASCVPSNWLDSLLTGPKKVASFPSCPDVEKLLNAVRERICALSSENQSKPQEA